MMSLYEYNSVLEAIFADFCSLSKVQPDFSTEYYLCNLIYIFQVLTISCLDYGIILLFSLLCFVPTYHEAISAPLSDV